MHYWPARCPISVCRAVTLATLLPDPSEAPTEVKAEYSRLSGSELFSQQREYLCDLITSLTPLGNENGQGDWNDVDQMGRWVNKLRIARELIQLAYDGRVPSVMDMFAGGGAIPLEAMRLGCEVTANDYNPVAWFILKCTLEYPQRFARRTYRLPNLNLSEIPELGRGNLADHVGLWAQWVLEKSRSDLATYYPVIDGKTTVAYHWARTIPCQDPRCGGIVPLLKTLWVCKKAEKILENTTANRERSDFLRLKKIQNRTKVIINAKRALKIHPDYESKQIHFEIFAPNNEEDIDRPPMSGATASCPFCGSKQPGDYIKQCGHEGKLNTQMTAVVYEVEYGKEYRTPTQAEMDVAEVSEDHLSEIATEIPHGLPDEALPRSDTSGAGRAFTASIYGFSRWSDLFSARQLLALMTFLKWTRTASAEMKKLRYSPEWIEAVWAYLALLINKVADYNCTCATWKSTNEAGGHLFVAARVPIIWNFVEVNIIGQSASSYHSHRTVQSRVLSRFFDRQNVSAPLPTVTCSDVLNTTIPSNVDLIVTDPPYYDAIPFADTSDFFFVWNKRNGFIPETMGPQTPDSVVPKDAELIQHTARFGGSAKKAKANYTLRMKKAFEKANLAMAHDALLVVVFAHKEPDAWETLLKAIIDVGFTVTASWPIDTEKTNRVRGMNSAALASSLWLVCRKRPTSQSAGHYGKVKREMQARITERLRYFWDAGIQGPDFVWAAIGPALESYSSYDEVRRNTGEQFTVSEFLTEVRRMVTDFALGQILHGASTEALDEWTRYYLMHMHHFGRGDAPVGECILLAQGYGVSLNDLTAPRIGILKKTSSGNALRLLGHVHRRSERVGARHASGALPIIDVIHRIVNLWTAGEKSEMNSYFTEHGLQESALFKSVVQALIEMNSQNTDERSLLETIIKYKPSPSASGESSNRTASDDRALYLFEDMEP